MEAAESEALGARAEPAITERLDIRISASEKRVIEQAAAILGRSVTSFVLSSMVEASRAIIDREQRRIVSERDFAHLMDLIENPPPPNASLASMARSYQKAIRDGDLVV